GLTSTAVKKGGLSTGEVVVSYSYKNTMVESKVDTESNNPIQLWQIFTTITVADIVPSTKVITSIKLPDLSFTWYNISFDIGFLTKVIYLYCNSLFLFSNSWSFAFGVENGYDTTSGNFAKYTAGVNVSKPESCASIISGDKGDTIKAWYLHHLDQLKKSVAVAEISRRFSTNENTFTVGGLYVVDDLTVVAAKLSNHGKLGAVRHQVIPKSMVPVSSEFDTLALDKCSRFGLTLALKP
ncbi:Mitochondrial outer membrane protein porin 2, partial [Bienertia sinuspersici]